MFKRIRTNDKAPGIRTTPKYLTQTELGLYVARSASRDMSTESAAARALRLPALARVLGRCSRCPGATGHLTKRPFVQRRYRCSQHEV